MEEVVNLSDVPTVFCNLDLMLHMRPTEGQGGKQEDKVAHRRLRWHTGG